MASIGVVATVTTLQPVEYTATASVVPIYARSIENKAANTALFISSRLAGSPTFRISLVISKSNLKLPMKGLR